MVYYNQTVLAVYFAESQKNHQYWVRGNRLWGESLITISKMVYVGRVFFNRTRQLTSEATKEGGKNMVRIRSIFFVMVPCLLLLFGMVSAAGAALPAYSLQNCGVGQSSCNTNLSTAANLQSTLANCAQGQSGVNLQNLLTNCRSGQLSSTSQQQITNLTNMLSSNCAQSGSCLSNVISSSRASSAGSLGSLTRSNVW